MRKWLQVRFCVATCTAWYYNIFLLSIDCDIGVAAQVDSMTATQLKLQLQI